MYAEYVHLPSPAISMIGTCWNYGQRPYQDRVRHGLTCMPNLLTKEKVRES
jgi:hypothetical protein